MPKLILKFDDRELQECAIGVHGVTIGRLPDNMLVIDNAAVSGRHARVYREGERYIVEDLKSTNGTFVDSKPITRHTLRDGDAMIVGKHTVVFSMAGGAEAAAAAPEAFIPEIGGTMMLDTSQHKDMMAGIESGVAAKSGTAAPRAGGKTERAAAPAQIGTLKVIAGRANESEYTLSAHTAIIGKADTALVRLSGWFKPKMAAAIARKGEGYSATALGAKVKVNGQPLVGRHDLKDGDMLEVSGLTLEFRLKPQGG
jgi:predicted component of type VI protein secretion system